MYNSQNCRKADAISSNGIVTASLITPRHKRCARGKFD
jgi:hypothetical protein